MDKATERDLVLQFKCAKEKREALKEELKQAQEEYEKTEFAVIEYLESNSAISTAKYEGLGYAQIQKPRLYASCKEENIQELFDFLKDHGREDLIKTTVLPQSLSSFTSECIENGSEIPECISYYLKPSLRLYS
jgi:hypothetical protein